MDQHEAASAFAEFVAVVKALRTPGTGCPWDLEQDHRTLRPYLVEEVYEVLDTIDRGDDRAFREELGDLLLQIVLHAQIADDRGAFAIPEVIRGITEKMVRRHPHVFGSVKVSGSAEVVRNWEEIKAAEKQTDRSDTPHTDALARLPASLPALLQAQRLGEKAAKVFPAWTALAQFLGTLQQQFAAFEHEVRYLDQNTSGHDLPDEVRARLNEQLGVFLFSVCQLESQLGLNAEESLRACNRRFVERFGRMEQLAARPLAELSRDELERLWQQAENAEKAD